MEFPLLTRQGHVLYFEKDLGVEWKLKPLKLNVYVKTYGNIVVALGEFSFTAIKVDIPSRCCECLITMD